MACVWLLGLIAVAAFRERSTVEGRSSTQSPPDGGESVSPGVEEREHFKTPPAGAAPAIWSFSGWRDEAESVETALASGLITHVAVLVGSRETSDTLRKPQTQAAIAVAKAAGVKLILVRFLWRTQPKDGFGVQTLTDPAHYVREINLLRDEAAEIGASLVGFDTEAYGPTAITEHMRKRTFTKEHYDGIAATIAAVVEQVGQVDFILPAGSSKANHPYMAIARFGKQRISEGTYYDRTDYPDWSWIKYPYEIPGLYVNVEKENATNPHLRYYLPSEVFGSKAHIWQSKQGLFIWPREGRASEVAGLLLDFSKVPGE
jgi:hypothetical protein